MLKSPRHIRVFLSSPGDVFEERALAVKMLEDLPHDPLLKGKITIEVVAWDQPGSAIPMLATLTPQEAINRGMPQPSDCDIVIVIFWKRMGTPLSDSFKKPDGSRYQSGTEWEYLNAVEAAQSTRNGERPSHPQVIVYRRDEDSGFNVNDPEYNDKKAQWERVERFFAAFTAPDGSILGGVNKYKSVDHFGQQFEQHMKKLIDKLLALPDYGTALSRFPRTSRPMPTSILIGRVDDLAWLHQGASDKLLIGQPGSGKTFLFRKLVDETLGLFVVNSDRIHLLSSIRAMRPTVLIVDDDVDIDEIEGLLLELVQIRQELNQKFSILVGGWPGNKLRIAQRLHLAESQVHELNRLTDEQIVEIVHAVGVAGPNQLIHEIVKQAEGRPGLAVALTELCSKEDIRKILTGTAIHDANLNFFEPLVGAKTTALLAGFSVGGDAGMSMQSVANCLELNVVEVQSAVTKFRMGGVFWEVDQEHISVRPSSLREALVREVFFQGATSLPVQPFLEQVPDFRQAVLTIMGAKARGARVPPEWLISIVEQADSPHIWLNYSSLGAVEARWVWEHHANLVQASPDKFLPFLPEPAILCLLNRAIGDTRPLHAWPEHPIRVIKDWALAGPPGTGRGVRRRKLLFVEVQKWLSSGGNRQVALSTIPIILSPSFESVEPDPGSDMRIDIYSSILTVAEMLDVQTLWPMLLNDIGLEILSAWSELREIIHEWAYNMTRTQLALPEDLNEVKRKIAATMLRDLSSLASARPGICHVLKEISRHADLGVDVPVDTDFEILYPEERSEAGSITNEQFKAVRELALAWSQLDPKVALQKVSFIEEEAQNAEVGWPRLTADLCEQIAANAHSPASWLKAAIEVKLGPELTLPFWRAANERPDSSEPL